MKNIRVLAIATVILFSVVGVAYACAQPPVECEVDCQTPSPTPTQTPTPSETPAPTDTPESTATPCVELKGEFEEPCETPTETPSATPEVTPTPETHFSDPGPAYAPQQALCGEVPTWAPTVTYDGQTGNTFHYHWTTVMPGLHTYWIWYGFTKDFMPYPLIVHDEKADITMFGGSSNWMKVAGFVEPGCFGPFSSPKN